MANQAATISSRPLERKFRNEYTALVSIPYLRERDIEEYLI